jgi:phosphatidylglycerol lysyltransferase
MTATLVPHGAPPGTTRTAPPAASPPAPESHRSPSAHERVRTWGTSSVSPFTLGPGREVHDLPGGGLIGFVRTGRWAVMATDPIAPPGLERETLDQALELLRRLRLRPLVVATADVAAHRDRGLWTTPIADDAVIDLDGFTLAGSRRANVRHSVSAARRAGLSVMRWSPSMTPAAAELSAAWLSTKRGGEMGFTLGPFDPDAMDELDGRVAVDGRGDVVAITTWHRYDNGRARVLDLMRRAPTAPNPAMDLLIAECLLELAAAGVRTASLGSVPRSHGALAERVYPTASLRRYKEKFAPRWEPRHLVVPSRRHLASGMLAVARAYSPDGLLAACRRNG